MRPAAINPEIRNIDFPRIETYEQSLPARALDFFTGDGRRVRQYTLTVQNDKSLQAFKTELKNNKGEDSYPYYVLGAVCLKMETEISNDDLLFLLSYMDKIQELTLMSNHLIPLYPILEKVHLSKLTIKSGYIFFDPGEIERIQQKFPELELDIHLQKYILHLDNPSTLSLSSYAGLLLFTLFYGLFLLDAAEKEVKLSSPDQRPVIPFNQCWYPLALITGASVGLMRLMSYIFDRQAVKFYELTRQHPIQTKKKPKKSQRQQETPSANRPNRSNSKRFPPNRRNTLT